MKRVNTLHVVLTLVILNAFTGCAGTGGGGNSSMVVKTADGTAIPSCTSTGGVAPCAIAARWINGGYQGRFAVVINTISESGVVAGTFEFDNAAPACIYKQPLTGQVIDGKVVTGKIPFRGCQWLDAEFTFSGDGRFSTGRYGAGKLVSA